MSLYLIDYDVAMSQFQDDNDPLIIIDSDIVPNKRQVENLLTSLLYLGSVYVNDLKIINDSELEHIHYKIYKL